MGLPVWYGSGVPTGTGLLCVAKDVHVVFYGEPQVFYNPYGNPLLHTATGCATVGIAVMGNTVKAFT